MPKPTSIKELDEIFSKYEELRKHLLPPTKDFLNELWNWKTRFVKHIANSSKIPYEVKCRILGEKSLLTKDV